MRVQLKGERPVSASSRSVPGVSGAMSCLCVARRQVRAVSHALAEGGKPIKGRVFNIGFCDGSHYIVGPGELTSSFLTRPAKTRWKVSSRSRSHKYCSSRVSGSFRSVSLRV